MDVLISGPFKSHGNWADGLVCLCAVSCPRCAVHDGRRRAVEMEGLRIGGLNRPENRVHGSLVGSWKVSLLVQRLLQRCVSGCGDRGADVKGKTREGSLKGSQRRL